MVINNRLVNNNSYTYCADSDYHLIRTKKGICAAEHIHLYMLKLRSMWNLTLIINNKHNECNLQMRSIYWQYGINRSFCRLNTTRPPLAPLDLLKQQQLLVIINLFLSHIATFFVLFSNINILTYSNIIYIYFLIFLT